MVENLENFLRTTNIKKDIIVPVLHYHHEDVWGVGV
jgi:hypothetical protein